jgi:hypothetical protein
VRAYLDRVILVKSSALFLRVFPMGAYSPLAHMHNKSCKTLKHIWNQLLWTLLITSCPQTIKMGCGSPSVSLDPPEVISTKCGCRMFDKSTQLRRLSSSIIPKRRKEGRWLEDKLTGHACYLLAGLALSSALSSLVHLIGLFVAFQLKWLPCGVIWFSSGLGVRMRFVQGSAQQSPPTAFPLFPSVRCFLTL